MTAPRGEQSLYNIDLATGSYSRLHSYHPTPIHKNNHQTESTSMSATPYFVAKATHAGDNNIKSSMSLLPTAEQQQAVRNSQCHVSTRYSQQLTFE
jgi:hypothetical protein